MKKIEQQPGDQIPKDDQKVKSLIEQFDHTLNVWIDGFERYDNHQLCMPPHPDSWSIGQVYIHLIEETQYFFQQVETCLMHDENAAEKMTAEAEKWFQNNSYPNEKLKGPPDLPMPHQPGSKTQLREDMQQLKEALDVIGKKIIGSDNTGKTKHPGHNYFNATEWFQFAEMHLRHHFRQKARIDTFLTMDCPD
jgi:hypothetical protein